MARWLPVCNLRSEPICVQPQRTHFVLLSVYVAATVAVFLSLPLLCHYTGFRKTVKDTSDTRHFVKQWRTELKSNATAIQAVSMSSSMADNPDSTRNSRNDVRHLFNVVAFSPSGLVKSEKDGESVEVDPVQRRFLQRKETVRNACELSSKKPMTLSETNLVYKNLVVDDKHRLLYCPVPKASSTSWMKVMLVLMGKYPNLKSITQAHRPKDVRTLITYNSTERAYRLKSYLKFMVAREPLSRFVSAYKYKFSDCHLDRTRETLCRHVVKYSRKLGKQHYGGEFNISIVEFAEYATSMGNDPVKQLRLNAHWRPMNVHCQPCHVDYDYYSSTETVEEDARFLLKKFHAPEWLHFPWENPTTNVTLGHMKETWQYLLALPPALIQKLINMYRVDYNIFSYKLPENMTKFD